MPLDLLTTSPKTVHINFDNVTCNVTCIYHHEVWHVYNVNCYFLPITKIIAPNITTFIQLNHTMVALYMIEDARDDGQ